MNAEELYDAFAQIDDDLLDGATGTVRSANDRSVKRIFKTAVAVLIVTLIFAAAEITVFAVGASYADMTLSEYFGKVFRKEINVDISGAVAVVNGEPIYKSSLDFLMQSSPNVDEKTALEELIKQVLLTQEAEKRCYGLRITDEDVKKTVETQMRYLKQIAALPESEQTESVRQLLSYLSENGITIEEYYMNEESFRTYRNLLMRSALLGDITKGETDPDKIIEKTESFKNELYEKAEIEILLAEEPPYVLYGDYMNTGRDMVVSGGRKIDDIVKTVGKRCVDEELESAKGLRDVPKGIYCDINIYYVSYHISGLGDLTPDAISKAPDAWPYIHIPIFCTYEGQKRVFGEVLLKPTVTDYSKMTWDYVRSDLVYHLPDTEPYKSGMDCKIWTVAPTREDLARFCLEKGIGEYKTAMHFFCREQWQDILLIQTDTGEYVYDIGDTLAQISGRPLTNDKIRVYTLREYKELLEAYLKEHGGQSGIGGGVGAVAAEKGEVGKTALWIAGAVLLCYVSALAVVIVKIKKHE